MQLSKDEKHLLVQRNINLESDVNHLKSELNENHKKIELCNVIISGKEQECSELLNTIQALESGKSNLQTSVDSLVIFGKNAFTKC